MPRTKRDDDDPHAHAGDATTKKRKRTAQAKKEKRQARYRSKITQNIQERIDRAMPGACDMHTTPC